MQALRLERDLNDGSGATMAEEVLLIIEAILLEASAVATTEGTMEDISTLSEDESHLTMLLEFMDSPHVVRQTFLVQLADSYYLILCCRGRMPVFFKL